MIETGQKLTGNTSEITEAKDIECIYNSASNAASVLTDRVICIESFISRVTGVNAAPQEVAKKPESSGSLGAIANALEEINDLNGRLISAVIALDQIG